MAHYVVSFHTLKEVNKHFWGAVVPPVLKAMFESWNWLKAKLLTSLRAPKEYTDFWKCSKWDLSYLINHWCTTRKLIGFELGAAP